MWWDIHLLYRKRLVKFQRFPEDEEDLEDVIDELEDEAQIRKERKEERKRKDQESKEYVKMLRDQKQELIDKAHEKEVARNISLGLPLYEKSEKELEDEKIEKERKKKEA